MQREELDSDNTLLLKHERIGLPATLRVEAGSTRDQRGRAAMERRAGSGTAIGSGRRGSAEATIGARPLFEHVIPEPGCSLVWRCDDYPWKRNAWNTHPEHEIHLIRNAAGVALIGDFIGRFEPGHLSIVGGGLPHHWASDVGPGETIAGRDIVLQFKAERLSDASATVPELSRLEPFLRLSRRGLSFHGETRRRCAVLIEEMGAVQGLLRFALLLEVLGRLAASDEYQILSSADFEPDIDRVSMSRIQIVLAHVLRNLGSGIMLGECAAMVEMSQSTFSRFFKKNTGNTFTDHVVRLRIARACELLATTEQPVTQICFDVGGQNLSNFNRNFRRLQRCTPTDYRRLAKRRAEPSGPDEIELS